MLYVTLAELYDTVYKRSDWLHIAVISGGKIVAFITRRGEGEKYVVTVYKDGQRTKETLFPYAFIMRNF